MKRIERKLFQVGDELAGIARALNLANEELIYHEHLNDDTQRDAAVSQSPIDRADARETASDVTRFKRHIAQLRIRQEKLEKRHTKLLRRLGTN